MKSKTLIKKQYLYKIIVNGGESSPFACDLIMPIPGEVRSLYSDEEWKEILEVRKKLVEELKLLLEELY